MSIPAVPTRYTGKVRFCSKSHEFGFIHHDTPDGACQLFFHKTEFRASQYLRAGSTVNYQLGSDRHGRVQATKCYVVEAIEQEADLLAQVAVLVHQKPSKLGGVN